MNDAIDRAGRAAGDLLVAAMVVAVFAAAIGTPPRTLRWAFRGWL